MAERHWFPLACAAVLLYFAATVYAFSQERSGFVGDPTRLNALIDQTNFIVGNGCSGTLISVEQRLILTNYHCIDHAIRIIERKVTGEGGRVETFELEKRERVPVEQNDYRGFDQVGTVSYLTDIVAHEKTRDLALLQLAGDNLRSTMDSDLLPVGREVVRGEPVVVVGNPASLDASVTAGIVSSVTRKFPVPWTDNEELAFIQHDAPQNGGNSGGALYNSEGYFIGVPSAGVRGADGLSLAIPVDLVREFLDEHCFASAYDPKAESHDECEEAKEEDEGTVEEAE